jgi:hypothetical protein
VKTSTKVVLGVAVLALGGYLVYRKVSGSGASSPSSASSAGATVADASAAIGAGVAGLGATLGDLFSSFGEHQCPEGYAWVSIPSAPNGGYCGRPCSKTPGCSVSVIGDGGMVLASSGPADGPITSPSQLP